MQADELDRLLQESDPARALTDDELRLAARMARRSTPRRRFVRPVVATAICALLLGGGSMAAAAAGFWPPWAQHDAFVELSVELPSGTRCELRLGDIREAPGEVEAIIRETFKTFELTPQIISDAANHLDIKANPFADDDAYAAAARWAVILRVERALSEHGIERRYQFAGEGLCS